MVTIDPQMIGIEAIIGLKKIIFIGLLAYIVNNRAEVFEVETNNAQEVEEEVMSIGWQFVCNQWYMSE